jgi:hypothetical protein
MPKMPSLEETYPQTTYFAKKIMNPYIPSTVWVNIKVTKFDNKCDELRTKEFEHLNVYPDPACLSWDKLDWMKTAA